MSSVLLVDDEVEICILLSSILRKEGYDTKYVHSLLEARRYIENNEFAIVILDLNLPDGLGYQLIDPIRKKYNSVKIIVISAYDGESLEAIRRGSDAFISKPFTKKTITDLLRKLNLPIKNS
ncbi:MAG: response regulator [Cyclobacteriaceae bacterium]